MILHYLQFDLAKNIWFSVFFEHDGHSPFQMAWIQVCVYPICLKLRVIIQFHLVNYFLKKLPYQGNDNIRTLWLAKSRKHDPSILRKHPVHSMLVWKFSWNCFCSGTKSADMLKIVWKISWNCFSVSTLGSKLPHF